MKKLFLAFLLLVSTASVTNAHQDEFDFPKITFQVGIKKTITGGNPLPKNPATTPDVYLDGHTLYLDSIGYDTTILLTDSTDTVVYSVFVPYGTTIVPLPSTLIGTYVLNIVPETGGYYFYSEIMF